MVAGPCYKLHDEKLKKDYEESDRRGKMGYENDFLSYLERMIRDLDRKIGRGQDRLRRSAEAKQQVIVVNLFEEYCISMTTECLCRVLVR